MSVSMDVGMWGRGRCVGEAVITLTLDMYAEAFQAAE